MVQLIFKVTFEHIQNVPQTYPVCVPNMSRMHSGCILHLTKKVVAFN